MKGQIDQIIMKVHGRQEHEYAHSYKTFA